MAIGWNKYGIFNYKHDVQTTKAKPQKTRYCKICGRIITTGRFCTACDEFIRKNLQK